MTSYFYGDKYSILARTADLQQTAAASLVWSWQRCSRNNTSVLKPTHLSIATVYWINTWIRAVHLISTQCLEQFLNSAIESYHHTDSLKSFDLYKVLINFSFFRLERGQISMRDREMVPLGMCECICFSYDRFRFTCVAEAACMCEN